MAAGTQPCWRLLEGTVRSQPREVRAPSAFIPQILPGRKLVGLSQITLPGVRVGACPRVGGLGKCTGGVLPPGPLDVASCLQAGTQPGLSPESPPGSNHVLFCCRCSFPTKVLSVQMLSSANPSRQGWPGVWRSPVSPDIFGG